MIKRAAMVPRLIALLPLALGCGGGPVPVATPAVDNHADEDLAASTSLTGVYRDDHEIAVVCSESPDGWCNERVTDSLILRQRDDGALLVAIDLTQTNAHSCSFSGVMLPVSPAELDDGVDAQWRFAQAGADEDAGCLAHLTLDGPQLTVTADGCREFCGARASLDASFAVATRVDLDDASAE